MDMDLLQQLNLKLSEVFLMLLYSLVINSFFAF